MWLCQVPLAGKRECQGRKTIMILIWYSSTNCSNVLGWHCFVSRFYSICSLILASSVVLNNFFIIRKRIFFFFLSFRATYIQTSWCISYAKIVAWRKLRENCLNSQLGQILNSFSCLTEIDVKMFQIYHLHTLTGSQRVSSKSGGWSNWKIIIFFVFLNA